MTLPRNAKIIALVIFLSIASTVLIRGTRVHICEATGICYFTCEEYSTGENKIEVTPAEVAASCEDSEWLKQKDFENKVKAILGLSDDPIKREKPEFSSNNQ